MLLYRQRRGGRVRNARLHEPAFDRPELGRTRRIGPDMLFGPEGAPVRSGLGLASAVTVWGRVRAALNRPGVQRQSIPGCRPLVKEGDDKMRGTV